MPSTDYRMLRSARRAHLEARTALLQRSFCRVGKFADSLASGGPGRSLALALNPRFRGHDEDS
jgi:hypothetical protein